MRHELSKIDLMKWSSKKDGYYKRKIELGSKEFQKFSNFFTNQCGSELKIDELNMCL